MIVKHCVMLIEELNELMFEIMTLIKTMSKYMRFGPNDHNPNMSTIVSNKELLEEEIGHVQYLIDVIINDLDLDKESIQNHILTKKNKVAKFGRFYCEDIKNGTD